MNAVIYYFSGSGNSLAVAKELSAALRAELVPIAGLAHRERVTTDADTVGLVFPVYDFKPPELVAAFMRKLGDIGGKYIFAVGTMGIAPMSALKKTGELLKARGGALSGGFAVRMPHNGIGSRMYSRKGDAKRLRRSREKIQSIITYVRAKEQGKVESGGAVSGFLLSGVFIRVLPTMVRLLRQVAMGGWKSIKLQGNGRCAGCGTCAGVCPVGNIRIVNHKPFWGEDCTGCLACLHWCPHQAIQLTKTNMNIRRYHHPAVELEDMRRQRAGGSSGSGA